jgi:curved DNA-binding protein
VLLLHAEDMGDSYAQWQKTKCLRVGIMKYKDYYQIMGLDKKAGAEEIKKAYRKLARKYHPDVSSEADAEEKFKEVAEAYETLKDPEKRAAYDQLGSYRSGEDFHPPPEWGRQYAEQGAGFGFEDIDLADLFAHFTHQRSAAGGTHRAQGTMPGQDYEVTAHITLEEAYKGTEINIGLTVPEADSQGRLQRVEKTIKARIPSGATDGQRLKLAGRGGKGRDGGRNGNLYLNIALHPHPLFRVNGHDLYLDLPLAPWEAALGATVQVPTLAGDVRLKIPSAARAGQKLRIADKGLPKPHQGSGDLYVILQISVPAVINEQERALYEELSKRSTFNPRVHFERS